MNGRLLHREPLAAAVLALAAVAAALVSQHHFDMQPCPWCVLQRLLFVAGAALALFEATGQSRGVQGASGLWTSSAALRALLAASGLAAALWQHFVASATASCNLTLADKVMAATRLDALLPDIFQARASCLDARVDLLGLPYELWSAALFAVLTLAAGTRCILGRAPAITGTS